MSEEVSVTIGTPQVVKTEAKPGGVEIKAYEVVPGTYRQAAHRGLSAHYAVRTTDDAPHIGEKLLVAVLSGVHPEWLDPESNIWATHDRGLEPLKVQEPVGITFQAVSAKPFNSPYPSRNDQHDTLHLEVINDPVTSPSGPFNGQARLRVGMKNESGSIRHAEVVLSKGQVTSMLAALLAIYPRLTEV